MRKTMDVVIQLKYRWQVSDTRTPEDVVTEILEHVGPNISVTYNKLGHLLEEQVLLFPGSGVREVDVHHDILVTEHKEPEPTADEKRMWLDLNTIKAEVRDLYRAVQMFDGPAAPEDLQGTSGLIYMKPDCKGGVAWVRYLKAHLSGWQLDSVPHGLQHFNTLEEAECALYDLLNEQGEV